MSDIKWVKLTVDMFDNRKIKYIRSLPEGNNIVLIWVMLLTIAGRCNAGGMIFLAEDIPYNYSMLAEELGFDVSVVKLALDVLAKLKMIICDENAFTICNWLEYQEAEGMDKIREQTKKRVASYRQRQKEIQSRFPVNGLTDGECNVTGNVTGNVTVTHPSYSNSDILNSYSNSNNKEEKKLNKEKKNDRGENAEVSDNVEVIDPILASHSLELIQAVENWLEYKKEKRQGYQPKGKSTLLKTIDKKAKEFGDDAVINAIEDTMANGYQGIVWDYLKKRGNSGIKGFADIDLGEYS